MTTEAVTLVEYFIKGVSLALSTYYFWRKKGDG